jgi:hypothetical protein
MGDVLLQLLRNLDAQIRASSRAYTITLDVLTSYCVANATDAGARAAPTLTPCVARQSRAHNHNYISRSRGRAVPRCNGSGVSPWPWCMAHALVIAHKECSTAAIAALELGSQAGMSEMVPADGEWSQFEPSF